MGEKEYLGDGVYVDVRDDGAIVLTTTENGIDVTNTIVMEPEVYAALHNWHARMLARRGVPG